MNVLNSACVSSECVAPKPDVSYLEGDIGYRVHTGGHTPAPDWPAFVEFTRKCFQRAQPAGSGK